MKLQMKLMVKLRPELIARKAKDSNEKALRHLGGFVRKIAQRSMRKRAGAAPPGRPPHAHGERPGIRPDIIYQYDPITKSVVIGPHTGKIVPELHEFGGTRRNRKYPERPYMHPALKKGIPAFKAKYAKEFNRNWKFG